GLRVFATALLPTAEPGVTFPYTSVLNPPPEWLPAAGPPNEATRTTCCLEGYPHESVAAGRFVSECRLAREPHLPGRGSVRGPPCASPSPPGRRGEPPGRG